MAASRRRAARRCLVWCVALAVPAAGLDETCWLGGYWHMYEACCLRGEKDCFAGEFTYERCCIDLQPPGDATCWIPPFSYYTCCEKYQRWFPSPNCFDGVYTFDRCCGGHLAVLQFGMKRRVKKATLMLAGLQRGGPPLLTLAVLSLGLRLAGSLWRGRQASGGKPHAARPRNAVPAATALRVFATCGIVAWHNLGHCGVTRECEGDFQMDLNYQVMSSFFVVQTDVFFVLSAYLLASRGFPSHPGTGLVSTVAATSADLAGGVLRRVVRTAPAFVLAASIGGRNSVLKLLRECWGAGILSGATWPYGKPLTWPFGVELLCLAALQAIIALGSLFGESAALASATALLAGCLERWRRREYRSIDPEAWHVFHFALGAHRLPLSLATFIMTRLLACGRSRAPATEAVANGAVKMHRTTACRGCCSSVLLALAWAAALAGMGATAAVEWCWMFGPRIVVPWWLYPFPAKMPLVVGCVVLLEVSRRTAASSPSAPSRAMVMLELLERRSLGVLLLHENVETRLLKVLPQHQRDLPMFWFQLPGLIFWVFVVSSVLVWVEDPFRRSFDWCLTVVHGVARGDLAASALRRSAALLALLAPAGACVSYAVWRTCSEGWPAVPCFL